MKPQLDDDSAAEEEKSAAESKAEGFTITSSQQATSTGVENQNTFLIVDDDSDSNLSDCASTDGKSPLLAVPSLVRHASS